MGQRGRSYTHGPHTPQGSRSAARYRGHLGKAHLARGRIVGRRHPQGHWTRATARLRPTRGSAYAGLQPENLGFFRSIASEARSSFSLPQPIWTARSLGDGARRTWSALHHCLIGTPVPTASSRNKCAGKLRKIKHLQRERGRNHYRGQKRARGCFCSQGVFGSCRVARAGR